MPRYRVRPSLARPRKGWPWFCCRLQRREGRCPVHDVRHALLDEHEEDAHRSVEERLMSRGEKSCLHSAGDVVELGDSVEDGWALQDPAACDAPTPGAELGVDGDGVGRSEGLRDALKEWHLLSMRGASRRDDHTVGRVLQAHTANCAARTCERPTTTEWLAARPESVPTRWGSVLRCPHHGP